MTGDPEMYGGVPFVEGKFANIDARLSALAERLRSRAAAGRCEVTDLAARLSALEARERHRVHAMRLLHRWMCGPELRRDDRAELTVAIAKADPDYLPPPEPSPTPGPSPKAIARVRALINGALDLNMHERVAVDHLAEALRLLDGAA